ncbi:MAG: V-type ATP synthase subunit E family protein [Nitrososphaeria archaeon]|nr:V-type ATP synthase subunit E family protein [Nitrososphaeria archaeon]
MSSDAIQVLKEEIWRRAREKAENIMKEAEEKAMKIIEAAEMRVREEVRSKIESEKLALKRRTLGKALMEGRREVISAKHEVLEKVFERVVERINTLRDSDLYRGFLVNNLKRAIKKFSDMNVEELAIYVNEKDLEFLQSRVRELNPPVKLKFRKGDFIGGMIVTDPEEKMTFYDTIEGRFESLKPILREKIASILFRRVE